MPNQNILNNKKIAIVIAFRDFRDIEYFIPKDILVRAGAKIFNVSTQKGIAIGADGGEVQIDFTIEEFRAEDFDAVIFIGGSGMGKNLDNKSFHKIAKEIVESDKILGAICIAPAMLAKAGLLQGRRATVWSGPLDKSAIKMLQDGGAEYVNESVIADGKIVTASGPAAAKEFAEILVQLLTEK